MRASPSSSTCVSSRDLQLDRPSPARRRTPSRPGGSRARRPLRHRGRPRIRSPGSAPRRATRAGGSRSGSTCRPDDRSCLRMSAGAGSRSKMWLRRTPSASQMRAIEERDGAVRSRSSWLMKPLVSPVAAASCSIVSPRSRRSDRTRAPTFGVSFRAASGVALGTSGSYAGLVQRQLRAREYRYAFCS